MTRRRQTKTDKPELESLDEIYAGMMELRSKLTGLSLLMMNTASDETGRLDLDEKMVGLGEILKDCSEQIEAYSTQISEYAILYHEKRKGRPRDRFL